MPLTPVYGLSIVPGGIPLNITGVSAAGKTILAGTVTVTGAGKAHVVDGTVTLRGTTKQSIAGNLTVTGAGKSHRVDGSVSLRGTRLGVTGALTVRNTVTITGAGKAHVVDGTVSLRGTTKQSIAGALTVTGAGKAHVIDGTVTLRGTSKFQIGGSVIVTGNGKNFTFNKGVNIKVGTGGTGAVAGLASAITNSAVISCSRIHTASLLFLTPHINTGVRVFALENRAARVPGTSFKIMLFTGNATAGTGACSWLVVQ